MGNRPTLSQAFYAFSDVNKSVSEVGSFIGGKFDYNINKLTKEEGRFENACAIRLSYVLNKTGYRIPSIAGQTVSGENGNWYIFRVSTLIQYLKRKFGEPDYVIDDPTASKLAKHKGIVVFEVSQWVDSSGHATIWNGVNCSDQCYFSEAKRVHVWILEN
ncbi:type VI secretion system amidase effector protein Tae4 [Thauera butanivorans]|uniref:type VI secretion system amidase effector protein Tae4 n=1 Tax=Thauera butanivorans TaxID=86174 RepID=UPI003AB8A450